MLKYFFILFIFVSIQSNDSWAAKGFDILDKYQILKQLWDKEYFLHKPTIYKLKARALVVAKLISPIKELHPNLEKIVKNFEAIEQFKFNSANQFIAFLGKIEKENVSLIEEFALNPWTKLKTRLLLE